MIKTPLTILEEDISDLFSKKPQTDIDILFSVVNLILFKKEHNTDMVELYNSLDLDSFVKLVHLFGGRTISFMKNDNLVETLLLAVCYFYRKIENKSWDKIQSYFGEYKLDRTSLALQIYNLDNFTKQRLQEQLRKLK